MSLYLASLLKRASYVNAQKVTRCLCHVKPTDKEFLSRTLAVVCGRCTIGEEQTDNCKWYDPVVSKYWMPMKCNGLEDLTCAGVRLSRVRLGVIG
jgi:hypothetical protein